MPCPVQFPAFAGTCLLHGESPLQWLFGSGLLAHDCFLNPMNSTNSCPVQSYFMGYELSDSGLLAADPEFPLIFIGILIHIYQDFTNPDKTAKYVCVLPIVKHLYPSSLKPREVNSA